MTRQKVGVGLVVAAYVLLLYISFSAPFYARAHPHLDPALVAQYASPWPLALGCALAVAGIMLALIPLRRGERWALWTQLAIFIILFVPRMMTDPRWEGCGAFSSITIRRLHRASFIGTTNCCAFCRRSFKRQTGGLRMQPC